MYYSTRKSGKGTIERRNMDGTNKYTVFNASSQLSWPSGMYLDIKGKMYAANKVPNQPSHHVIHCSLNNCGIKYYAFKQPMSLNTAKP